MYGIDWAGENCWDVFSKRGAYAGLICGHQDGTFRHYYNASATKGSKKKFPSFNAAMENLHKHRVRKFGEPKQ